MRERTLEAILLPGPSEFPHALWNVWDGRVACADPAEYRMCPHSSQVIVFNSSIVAQLRDVTPSPSASLALDL